MRRSDTHPAGSRARDPALSCRARSTQAVDVPAAVEFASDGSATVRGKMSVSLDAFEVARPSLLFVKIDDDCTIDFTLKLRRS